MNKEVAAIIKNIETTLHGEPWFGRAIFELLSESDPATVAQKPNEGSHSLLELLYHMITWAEFTLAQLEEQPMEVLHAIEARDWRDIDPAVHDWKKGIKLFESLHKKISKVLSSKEDAWLKEMVPGRRYNFRFMLNGLIQHNIYHAGQIAQLNKWLG